MRAEMTEGEGSQAQRSRTVSGWGVRGFLGTDAPGPDTTNSDDSLLHSYIKFCQDTYRE